MSVRVRFAPSPTGEPHIGNIRTVVFNWLFARKMGGTFILRIEDTDRERYLPDTMRTILEGIRWLGLNWDEGPGLEELKKSGVKNPEEYAVGGPCGPYIQSERLGLYSQVAEELIRSGHAYRCNCTPERLEQVRAAQQANNQTTMYDRHCRDLPTNAIARDEPHVVRLKVPLEGQTIVPDMIKGDIVFENALLDDQVLLKTDGFPTYHLAVVVDDHYMDISHIIRGDDWIASTPKRMMIYQALGWKIPVYCHVPLVNGPDGKKLSKRHGATSITQFRAQGYLPEALLNFLARLGWSPGEGEEQEIFTRDELIQLFELGRINRAPAVFSYDKLDWMNGAHIRALSQDTLAQRVLPFLSADLGISEEEMGGVEKVRKLAPLFRERIKHLTEAKEWCDFLFVDFPPLEAQQLVGKNMDIPSSLAAVQRAIATLETLPTWTAASLEEAMRNLVNEMGLKAGQLFGIIRNAITGKQATPPLFDVMELMGKEKAISRLRIAEGQLRKG